MSVPPGVIWPWYHTEEQIVPDGWELCNGENGTPDLRGRFLLGASDDHDIGSTGGSEEVTLTIAQMPSHSHSIALAIGSAEIGSKTNALRSNTDSTYSPSTQIGNTGAFQTHPNMLPYFTVDYIIKL